MLPFVIVLVIAVIAVLILGFAVRLPLFETPRARLVTIIMVALIVVVGGAGLRTWAVHSADDQAADRSRQMRVVLLRYRDRPLDIITDDPPGLGLSSVRSTSDGAIVESQVSQLGVFRCIHARVTRTRVVITTGNRECP